MANRLERKNVRLQNDLFLRACRREPVERTPIWMMRQAGRYLPSYQALRRRHSFRELCETPSAAAEAALQPVEELEFDAAILFSDIMVPVQAMGLEVEFDPGPKLARPVRTAADAARLRVPDPAKTMPVVAEAIAETNRRLAGRVPLIGFAGAPFTLAAYVVEGGGSKSWSHLLGMMHGDPETLLALQSLLADTVIAYLEMQIAAGAHAVQLFDSWAGLLSDESYRRFELPFVKRIASAIEKRRVPFILYANGGAHLLAAMKESGATVLSVDWRLGLDRVRAIVGDGVALQGNLDPCALHAPDAALRELVADVLRRAGPVGHVFNLGHGIHPEAPLSGVRAMVRAVRELSSAAARGAISHPAEGLA
jgi:uroporphyrinogen decarboxylase